MSITEKKSQDKKTILYTVMYMVMGFSSMYYTSMYKMFDWPEWIFAHIPQAIFYTLGLYKIFILDKHSKSELAVIIIFAVINIITLLVTDLQVAFLFFFFVIFAAKDVDYSVFLKTYFAFILSLFLFNLVSSLVGIIPNLNFDGRMCFGIGYPTDFGAYVFYFFLTYSYLSKKHGILYTIIGVSLASFILYFSRARLDCGMILITVLCFVINEHANNLFENKVIKTVLILSPFILMGITAALALCYNPDKSILVKLDNLLSGRIYLMNKAYREYSVPVFGQVLPVNGRGWSPTSFEGEYFFLDNYYSFSLYRFGIVHFIALWSIVSLSICYGYKINDIKMVLVFLMLAGTSFIDHHIIELCYNAFFVFSGISVFALFDIIDKNMSGVKSEIPEEMS